MRLLIVSEGKHELGEAGGDSALETLVRRLLGRDVECERRKVSDPAVRVNIQRLREPAIPGIDVPPFAKQRAGDGECCH